MKKKYLLCKLLTINKNAMIPYAILSGLLMFNVSTAVVGQELPYNSSDHYQTMIHNLDMYEEDTVSVLGFDIQSLRNDVRRPKIEASENKDIESEKNVIKKEDAKEVTFDTEIQSTSKVLKYRSCIINEEATAYSIRWLI